MGSRSTRGTGVLPFFCAVGVREGSGFDVRDGEMERVRSAGFMAGYRSLVMGGSEDSTYARRMLPAGTGEVVRTPEELCRRSGQL